MKVPKRRFPGIKPRHTGGVWKWRACFVLAGTQHVGAYRLTQEEAHKDYEGLRAAGTGGSAAVRTLGEALGVIEQTLRLKGRSPRYIANNHTCRAKYLLSFWEPDSPLRLLTEKEVQWFIDLALASRDEDGHTKKCRHPNTLLEKDLPLLHRCFLVAGLPSPVKKAERPKRVRPEIECFSIEEAASLVERMRHGELTVKVLPQHREVAADIVQFMLQSGIRAGELGRVRVEDVNWASMKIRVTPKVSELLRSVAITPVLEPVVRRLVARAGRRRSALLIPGGMEEVVHVCQRWQRYLREPRLNARALRHTAGTAIAEAEGLLAARDFLGHAKATTTDRYLTGKRGADRAASLDRWFKPAGGARPDAPA